MRVKFFFFLMKGQAFINANRKNRRLGVGVGWHESQILLS